MSVETFTRKIFAVYAFLLVFAFAAFLISMIDHVHKAYAFLSNFAYAVILRLGGEMEIFKSKHIQKVNISYFEAGGELRVNYYWVHGIVLPTRMVFTPKILSQALLLTPKSYLKANLFHFFTSMVTGMQVRVIGFLAPVSYRRIALEVVQELETTFCDYKNRLLIQDVDDGGE